MNDFIYSNNTRLVYGSDVENKVGQQLKQLGVKSVLLVYGRNSSVESGLLGRVGSSLSANGIDFVEFGGVVANPLKSHMLRGIELAKSNKVDFVLGVGGGSVLDEAKAIAAGALNDDVWQFFVDKSKVLDKALPIGAVLTLPATGSENSTATVIRDDASGLKSSFNHDLMRPIVAWVNPKLMFSLPKTQIANGASDMLAHMLERYFSPQRDVVATDHLLKGGILAVFDIALKLYRDNLNYQLWSEFCLLGTMAHNGMLSLGRTEQDWGTHIIENLYLSGVHNIAHGTGLAIMFVAWLKYMSKKRPQKVLQFCKEVMQATGSSEQEILQNGISKLAKFYQSLDLPTSLSEIGLDCKQINEMVKKKFDKTSSVGSYGLMNVDDICAVFELAQ